MGVVSYQDQLSIETPEQVALSLPVAGIGSRFLAILVDSLIQIAALTLFWVSLALLVSGSSSVKAAEPTAHEQAWAVAILIFLHFLVFWGYFTLFEGLARGQTPGKRLFKLRVIKDSGRQVTFAEAMARNLLRVVDMLPGMYLTGILAILFNRQRKRLGDMVAGTLVVHTGEDTDAGAMGDGTRTLTIGTTFETMNTGLAEEHRRIFPATAIARLKDDDLVLLDTYFARIPDLDVATKDALAQRLLGMLCRKMEVEQPADTGLRELLDAIAEELRNQVGLQTMR